MYFGVINILVKLGELPFKIQIINTHLRKFFFNNIMNW